MLRADLEPTDALALGWLSADFRGRMIIDPLWRIHWWNDAAKRAIGASSILQEQDCQLIVDAAIVGKFSTFLSHLKAQFEIEILTLKDGAGHFLMLGYHDPATEFFCLEVRSSQAQEHPIFADFRSIYGLTESEGHAARALLGGQTVTEIARDRNVALDTVRTQVRKLYGKIGAQSREKFFKLLLPFRII
ncbi:helix-turn-helix transcriptional regulator [Sphingobium tyrosinilyticum]|uniref:Helix-turn-helix transcriptional regulator n=1 Tax=Sphingobium tyrosinilyticum TaxID=2715436 RepID=A0ABV9EWH9_9SPHN